jgi:anti-sigma factor RsiW
MTCREFADFIHGYLTGELRADVLALFEEHIAVCANCVTYLAQYRDAMAMGRAAFDDLDADVPDDVPEDLVGAMMRCLAASRWRASSAVRLTPPERRPASARARPPHAALPARWRRS